jgi:hypothetical protein
MTYLAQRYLPYIDLILRISPGKLFFPLSPVSLIPKVPGLIANIDPIQCLLARQIANGKSLGFDNECIENERII